MRLLAAILLVLVAFIGCSKKSGPATGTPVAKITGESNCTPGDLVFLSHLESKGKGKDWAIHPKSAKNRMHIVSDGVVFASSKPGEYTFYLGVADNNDIDMTSHVLNNGNNKPDDPDDDDPDDDDDIPIPDDWLGKIEHNSYLLAKKYVPIDNRYQQSQILVTAVDTVCSQIAAGIYENTEQARVAIRKTTNDAMGSAAADWEEFSIELAKGLKKYSDEGKLKTLSDYKNAWSAVAKGLRKIPKPTTAEVW